MLWKYRYVNFGTVFKSVRGTRKAISDGPASELFENELVLDVGATSHGYNGEDRWIIDHHFVRDHQFPCASAAVIHKADQIREHFRPLLKSHGPIWLVSHRQPDFDAFCSMYLARTAIFSAELFDGSRHGIHQEGWIPVQMGSDNRRFDWYRPDLRGIRPEWKWQILLASFACHIDNCVTMSTPKARSLHSILYAAIERGRDYRSEESGAVEFFEEVARQMRSGLNPLFDSVLEHSWKFAPELAMLDREIETYQRDIKRSRRVIVTVQSHPKFDQGFEKIRSIPLLDERHHTRVEHSQGMCIEHRQVDGIYIRRPECLLFKEWARSDIHNSTFGRGFIFTAVAYPRGRPEGAVNTTDYVFSLDPEKADGAHLYNVWAILQTREAAVLRSDPGIAPAADCAPRTEYRSRAGEEPALFADPWYDGENYSGTILGTPNRGTAIGAAGMLDDLSDDPIAAIVRNEIELSMFTSDVSIEDLPTRPGSPVQNAYSTKLETALEDPKPPVNLHLRYIEIRLRDDSVMLQGGVGQQIGRVLWGVLNAEEGVPTDFVSNHLVTTQHWVAVWSRHGVGVGYRTSAEDEIKALRSSFADMARLARDMYEFLLPDQAREPADNVKLGDKLMRSHVHLKHDLTMPGSRVLRRFLESVRMDEALATLRDVNASSAEQLRQKLIDQQSDHMLKSTETIAAVQTKVEWLEIFFVGIYATEFTKTICELLEVRHNLAALFTIIAAAGFTLAAAYVLEPWEHNGPTRRPLLILVLMICLWVLALVGVYKVPQWMQQAIHSEQVSGPPNAYDWF